MDDDKENEEMNKDFYRNVIYRNDELRHFVPIIDVDVVIHNRKEVLKKRSNRKRKVLLLDKTK